MGGLSCGGGGRVRQKTNVGEAGHKTAGGDDEVDPISKLHTNKRRSLGPEW